MLPCMTTETIRATDRPSAADIELLERGIYEFNVAATGHRDGRLLAVFARDASGAIRAGLSGYTWGGCAEVKLLWVREAERHAGLGSALLREAEREARARGCTRVLLATHDFQAPAFYARHGYTVCGEMPDYPSGHSQIFLQKTLA